ncbi:MAG: toll/interleukin-1 receptor domain-containing protein [Deltaproteobacteria bacterium]
MNDQLEATEALFEPNVFLSYSGERSKALAVILKNALGQIDGVTAWLADADIYAGDDWREKVTSALERAAVGVLCLTRENHRSPWVHFEAGHLAHYRDTPVIPYRLELEVHELEGPLAQYQTCACDERGTFELFRSVVKKALGVELEEERFGQIWPDLRARLEAIPESPSSLLDRYELEQEPRLVRNGETIVTGERAYNLLLHMFRSERFDCFRAFDLAFRRWEELLDSLESQVNNYSRRILLHLEAVFKEQRCNSFRRILVIDRDHIDTDKALEVLDQIAKLEDRWRRTTRTEVETRVYFSTHGDLDRKTIASLHDFAVFCGDEDLAIVEKTLTSPADTEAEHPQCSIIHRSQDVLQMKNAFDKFWSKSIGIPDASSDLRQSALDPKIAECLRLFRERVTEPNCAVVVEAGYLDLRDPSSPDRLEHLDDALRLFSRIRRDTTVGHERVLPEAFLNDFTDELCQARACGLEMNERGEKLQASKIAKKILGERYCFYDLPTPHVFGMKGTRDRAASFMLAQLKADHPDVTRDVGEDGQEDIYLEDTPHGRVLLGYLRNGGTHFVPRCTSLIAQHYWDLYSWASETIEPMHTLWQFDFNFWIERQSVRDGAAVAFQLYPWPDDISLNIVNFLYAPGDDEARRFDIHSHP